MTDFLNNLARRSLGSAETLQPRLPGLFEPPPLATGLLDERVPVPRGWREEQLDENPLERDPSAGLYQGLTSQPRAAAFDAARMASKASNASAHSKAVPSATFVSDPATGPHPPATMTGSPLVSRHPALSASVPLREAHVNASRRFQPQSSRMENGGVLSQRHLRDAEPMSKASPDSRDRRAENELRLPLAHTPVKPLAAGPHSVYSGAKGLPPPIQRVIGSRIAPQAKHGQAAASAQQLASGEPVIHVTIGRIEVRATQQQTQPPRARPASPVMSLDEYLRRRSQRGGQ